MTDTYYTAVTDGRIARRPVEDSDKNGPIFLSVTREKGVRYLKNAAERGGRGTRGEDKPGEAGAWDYSRDNRGDRR